MITTAPALLRRATTNRIGSVLKRGTVGDAGLFGGPATLPTNPGPPDPPILPGAGLPNNAFGPAPALPPSTTPWTTRLDPNMGYLNPSIQVTGGGPTSSPNSTNPIPTGVSFGPGGRVQGGLNGPQGSIYGFDPNTQNPIYNATGSPFPGFFDSTTGKIVETTGATGLNMLAPGLGSVSRWILDAIRRRNTAAHTGTDLSGQQQGPGAAAQAPNSPAWFQRGYQPPSGIQNAIARGDYQSAYGQSPQSASNSFQMWAASLPGTPNNTGNTQDAGHTMFYPNAGTPMGQFDPESGQVVPGDRTFGGSNSNAGFVFPSQSESARLGLTMGAPGAQAYNEWLMAHNPTRYNRPAPLPPAVFSSPIRG